MLDKAQILASLSLAKRDVESIPFGGTLCIRELTRAQWRACTEAAASEEDGKILLEPWYGNLFAVGVIGADGQPLFTAAEIADFPNRDAVWEEVARVAQLILDLSEVGADALKKK